MKDKNQKENFISLQEFMRTSRKKNKKKRKLRSFEQYIQDICNGKIVINKGGDI